MVGIYKFTNRITEKSYIGKSIDIKNRYYNHKNNADPCKPGFENTYFHREMVKYGFDAYDFTILEECEPDALNEREIYYIKTLGTLYPDGYNIEIGGIHSPHSTKLSWDNIYQIHQDLKDCVLTIKEIAQKYGVCISAIYYINSGKHWRFDDETYPLRSTKIKRKNDTLICKKCGKPILYSGCNYCRKCFYEERRRFTPTKEELSEMLRHYKPTELAKKLNVCRNTILNWRKMYRIDCNGNDVI